MTTEAGSDLKPTPANGESLPQEEAERAQQTISNVDGNGQVETSLAKTQLAKVEVCPEVVDLPQIERLIADPGISIDRILRVIAQYIVRKLEQSQDLHPLQYSRFAQQQLNSQINVLREVQKTLTESVLLSRRAVLDLDGPKFAAAYGYMTRMFTESMRSAGIPQDGIERVVREYRDLTALYWDDCKREIKNADCMPDSRRPLDQL